MPKLKLVYLKNLRSILSGRIEALLVCGFTLKWVSPEYSGRLPSYFGFKFYCRSHSKSKKFPCLTAYRINTRAEYQRVVEFKTIINDIIIYLQK